MSESWHAALQILLIMVNLSILLLGFYYESLSYVEQNPEVADIVHDSFKRMRSSSQSWRLSKLSSGKLNYTADSDPIDGGSDDSSSDDRSTDDDEPFGNLELKVFGSNSLDRDEEMKSDDPGLQASRQ